MNSFCWFRLGKRLEFFSMFWADWYWILWRNGKGHRTVCTVRVGTARDTASPFGYSGCVSLMFAHPGLQSSISRHKLFHQMSEIALCHEIRHGNAAEKPGDVTRERRCPHSQQRKHHICLEKWPRNTCIHFLILVFKMVQLDAKHFIRTLARIPNHRKIKW